MKSRVSRAACIGKHWDSIGNNPKQHEQNCLNSDNANILKMLRSSAKVLERGFGTAAGLLRRRARRIPSDQPDQPAISAMLINVYQCCICYQWNANGAVSDCFILFLFMVGSCWMRIVECLEAILRPIFGCKLGFTALSLAA